MKNQYFTHSYKMFSLEETYFIAAVNVADNGSVEEKIDQISDKVLKQAFQILWNLLRTEGDDSDYRSTLELIQDEMTSRGITPKTKKSSR